MIYFSCLVDVSHEVKLANFLQVLQPGVRRRKDPHPAPKGEALQVSHLPQEALHGAGTLDPLHAGPQGDDRQGTENGESFSIPLTSLLSVLGLSTLNIYPQVPNSLPNRNNIEIEIYGMEGIPPEDAKEHERQKAGGSLVTGGLLDG